ncbi:DUF6133 family protein [Clostridium boliviensis]|uniref:DUF6133 family protein n=1 Tax=Clostridium boliviensis TaxID=318465 RepID=A0ABU4GJ29_9CLOT|nr:DUF6133 family protein [Clostridium boliviensis]MDW2797628.1 DUF6133 family protein [Clostridium boliviensis]
MRNPLNKVRYKMSSISITIERKLVSLFDKTKDTLTVSNAWKLLNSQRGEGFVDTAIKILISVVIGALVLSGLYALFGETVLPTLKERIVDMFNYGG